jgi:hypothetical protein
MEELVSHQVQFSRRHAAEVCSSGDPCHVPVVEMLEFSPPPLNPGFVRIDVEDRVPTLRRQERLGD